MLRHEKMALCYTTRLPLPCPCCNRHTDCEQDILSSSSSSSSYYFIEIINKTGACFGAWAPFASRKTFYYYKHQPKSSDTNLQLCCWRWRGDSHQNWSEISCARAVKLSLSSITVTQIFYLCPNVCEQINCMYWFFFIFNRNSCYFIILRKKYKYRFPRVKTHVFLAW